MGNGACGQSMKFSQFISDAPSSTQFFRAPTWALHGLQFPSEPVTFSGMGSSRCCSVDICFYMALRGLQCGYPLWDVPLWLQRTAICREISVPVPGASPPQSFLGSIGLFLTLFHSLLNSILTLLSRFSPRCPTWLNVFSCVWQWVQQELTGIIHLPHRATLASPHCQYLNTHAQ